MNKNCPIAKEQNRIDRLVLLLILAISLIALVCNLQAAEINADEEDTSLSTSQQEQSQQTTSAKERKERYKQKNTSTKALTSDVSDTEILEAFRRHERLYCGNNIVSKRLNWRLENGMLTKGDVFYLPSNCSILR